MARVLLSLVVLLVWCEAVSAQQFDRYIFGVAGVVVVPRSDFTRWNGNFVYAGAGGEARLTERFALGGEAGTIGP